MMDNLKALTQLFLNNQDILENNPWLTTVNYIVEKQKCQTFEIMR